MKAKNFRILKGVAVTAAAVVALSGCSLSPYKIPFPGGASTGSNPVKVQVEFRDVLDLVPQSAVKVNDVTVGKVTNIKLNGWTAVIDLKINRDAKLPANAIATIRQTSLLGEKFVSLGAPPSGGIGTLKSGDKIPLSRSGRNPELEEVLGAASLLFNGGGLEKTKTVVQELNKTLDGNETEVKQLLQSANSFISQLDTNKEALLTSLEKVNNVAIEANKQKSAITGALDNLPGALKVVNDQRDELVKLLQALNRLGDVGTRVVKESKADTVADLKALGPVLQNLAKSGDDLSKSLTTLLTFPFTDGSVGGPTVQGAKDFQYGDYFNLSIRADVSLEQLTNLLGLPAIPALSGTASAADATTSPSSASGLAELVGGLVPKLGTVLPDVGGLLGGSNPTPKAGSTTAPQAQKTPSGPKLPQLCSLLGSCRVAPSNLASTAVTDFGRILFEPVVAS